MTRPRTRRNGDGPPDERNAPDAPNAGKERSAAAERFADLVADVRRIDGDRGPQAGVTGRAGATRLPPITRTKPAAGRRSSPDDARPASFRWRDPSNRHLAAAPGVSDRELARLARGEPDADERIDLHGTRLAEAARLLARRIESAQARGLRCVLVVHGRGRGSATNDAPLRDAVPDWLTRGETGRRVLAFAQAPRNLGGEGATLVLLRKRGDED